MTSLRLGARPSELAQAQVRLVAERLGVPSEAVAVTTDGDVHRGRLDEIGGKGVFVAKVDAALAEGSVDAAVHSLKDVPGDQPPPPGTVVAAYLPRADPRDAVLFAPSGGPALASLPPGSVVGTGSVRRAAQVLSARPDLRVEHLRGNVDTRIAALRDPQRGLDAIVLSLAGLSRLGLAAQAGEVLSTDTVCPPVGAGIVAVRCRAGDAASVAAVAAADDPVARVAATAERALLRGLAGTCGSPIAGHARLIGPDRIHLRAVVYDPSGTRALATAAEAPAADAAALGATAARDLLDGGARDLIG
ncbi:hydroxymethylbilane synthase [Nocardiopsis coralliicola]